SIGSPGRNGRRRNLASRLNPARKGAPARRLMASFPSLPALWRVALAAALVVSGACALGCDDEAPAPAQPLAGSKPGTHRYIVHLKGAPPDATAYREALAKDP